MAGKQKRKKQKEPPVPALLPNPLGTEMPNYITYRMTWAETLLAAALAFAAGGICSQVFYGGLFLRDGEPTLLTYISAAIFIIGVGGAAVVLFLPVRRDQLRKKRQDALKLQFRDMLESVTASLAAGGTVYQAFESAYGDICLQYGDGADLARELEQLLQAPQSGVKLEEMLQDFALRSGCEDIESFSSVHPVEMMRLTDTVHTEITKSPMTHLHLCESGQYAQ